jgi:phosphatidylglycerophosphatase GEP4
MNIPAILSLFRVARDPSLCLPHATVPTFADLPIPLSRAFGRNSAATSRTRFIDRETDSDRGKGASDEDVDIRAVVLDKDNCFAEPHTDEVFPAYSVCRMCVCYSPKENIIPRTRLIA